MKKVLIFLLGLSTAYLMCTEEIQNINAHQVIHVCNKLPSSALILMEANLDAFRLRVNRYYIVYEDFTIARKDLESLKSHKYLCPEILSDYEEVVKFCESVWTPTGINEIARIGSERDRLGQFILKSQHTKYETMRARKDLNLLINLHGNDPELQEFEKIIASAEKQS